MGIRGFGGAFLISGLLALAPSAAVQAQVLDVVDDEYGIPFGAPLLIEAFGVLDNDLLDGEPAGENGVTVSLVTDAVLGTLSLSADGSFTYSPGLSFDGLDQFVYEATDGVSTAQGMVVLSACSGGPTLFDCWNENAYRTKLGEFGFTTFDEGFENAVVWGGLRTPNTAMSVTSQGIEWHSNHTDPPASNPITTSSGAAHSGQWGAYDANHGYATGSPGSCDIDNPPVECLYYDGLTGTRVPGGSTLHGVGAYVHGTFGANIGILLDGAPPIGGGKVGTGSYFFGAIDASPTGFTEFQFRESDGKVGQALYIWLDDFVIARDATSGVADPTDTAVALRLDAIVPNPTPTGALLRFTLPHGATAKLAIHDVRGRLVLDLGDVRSSGEGTTVWYGRGSDGHMVSSGVYFARLVAQIDGAKHVRMRKIIVTR